MALNADEKKLLEELNARANEPDEDDDFEIEVYDTSAGKGARIPYKKGKNWLHATFGIGQPDAPEAPEEPQEPEKPAKGGAYFGGRK